MTNNIFIFEDDKYVNFLPLVYLRPVYDLVCGMSPMVAKIVRNFPQANIYLHCRDYLKNITKQNHAGIGVNNINTGGSCLLVNGRVLAGNDFASKLILDGKDRIFLSEETEEVAAMYLNTENLYIIREMLDDVFTSRKIVSALRNKTEITNAKVSMIENLWDLHKHNQEQLNSDFEAAVPAGIIKGDFHQYSVLFDEYKVFVGEGSRVFPGVVINAEKGPVYIGENCSILPNTYIEGPAYVGNNSVIGHSRLMGGTSLGPGSKIVRSEIANTIMQGYSTVENSTVEFSFMSDAVDISCGSKFLTQLTPFAQSADIYPGGDKADTGLAVLGAYIADFSRIGSNTIVKPGTIMGISTNCEAGNNTLPKYIPSFIYQTAANKFDEFSIKEVLANIEFYLGLKALEFTVTEKDLVEFVFSKYPYDRKTNKIID